MYVGVKYVWHFCNTLIQEARGQPDITVKLPASDEQDAEGQMGNADRGQDVQDATLILVPHPASLPTRLIAEN